MPEDITKTGPVGLEGLTGINKTKQQEADYLARPLEERLIESYQSPIITPRQAHQQILEKNVGAYTPISTGQDFGSSRFDKPIISEDEVSRIGDIRAQEQSGLEQIGMGAVKMGSTAVTTFLDSTLGLIFGLGQGLNNALDDDPETSFIRGLWDNDFNKAMANVQEKMEEIAPNYYTQEQLDSPWYSAANLLSANFWGDKFLKNMGFTIGAMATMAVPGFEASWLAKGVSGIGKGLNVGGEALKGFNTAGKVAQRVANTLVSASGEGMIEAVNAVQDNYDAEVSNLENIRKEAIQEAEAWYEEHKYDIPLEGHPSSYQTYMDRLNTIDAEYNQAIQEMQNGMRNVGNSVYLANLLILSLTNNLEFGKYLKGGYNLQKGFEGLDMLTKEGKTESLAEFGRALARKEGSLAVAEDLGKVSPLRATAQTLGRAFTEGFEEGSQRLASDTEQMKEQSRVNVWAKETGDSFYAKGINPDVTDDLVDRYKALHAAWNASFGDASSSGWEEVLLGALTGGIGTFGIKRNKNGKAKLGWQGGFYEEFISKPKERLADAEKMVADFTERFTTDEALNRLSHAITAMSLTEEMDNFLAMGDVLNYKNKELAAVVNDALFFKNAGALDAYVTFYKEMAQNVSDEDIEQVKTQLKLLVRGISPYDGYSNDQIREILTDKAQSTYDKIQKTLDYHHENSLRYYDRALKSAKELYDSDLNIPGGAESLAEGAIRELTAKEVLLWDLMRRKEELQNQIDSMDSSTKAIRGTANEERAIKQIEKEIDKRTKEYEDLKDFDSNVKDLQRQYQLAIIRRSVKDGEGLKTALLGASDLQAIADAYFASEDKYKQNVFDEAVSEAEGQQKTLLESFQPFLGAINAMEDIVISAVQRAYPDSDNMTEEELKELENNRNFISVRIGDILDSVISNYIYDAEKDYSKHSLVDAIRELSDNDKLDNSIASILRAVADGLEVNEALYQAAAPRPESEENEDDESTETFEEGDEESEDDEDDILDKAVRGAKHIREDSGEENEEEPLDPGTTITKDRKGSISYLKRYFKKSLGNDLDKVIGILEQDDPSDEDRQFIEDKLSHKKYDKFKELYFRNYVKKEPEIEEDNEDEPLTEDDLPEPDGTLDDANKDSESKDEKDKAELSVRANPYRPYLIGTSNGNGLAAGIARKAIEYAKNTKYYKDWYSLPFALGIDYIVNNYLQDIIDTAGEEGKLKVYYAKYYDNSGVEAAGLNHAHILLLTPYTEKVKDVLDPKNTAIANNIIKYEKKNYLVVGAYGYSTGAKNLAEAQEKISEAISAQRSEKVNNDRAVEKNWEILKEGKEGAGINYIYEVSPGYIVYKNDESDNGDISLKAVLDTNNPKNISIKDIPFSIWMGHEDSKKGIYPKHYGFPKGARRFEYSQGHFAGQVYLWMQAANGYYIPVYVTPLDFNQINAENNGTLYKDIEEQILAISNNRGDSKKIKRALGILRGGQEGPGLLVFSTEKFPGTKVIYAEGSNEIVFEQNGEYLKDNNNNIIKIELGSSATDAEVFNAIVETFKKLNPRVAIHSTVMRKNPEYYLNSNILMVNPRQWGTVNAKAFAYPVDKETGKIPTKFKPSSQRTAIKRMSEIEDIVWIGNSKYLVLDKVIYDSNMNQVTDQGIIQQYIDILNIKHGNVEEIDLERRGKYYIINGRAYHLTRGGHYNLLDEPATKTLKDRIKEQRAKEELKSGKGALLQEASDIQKEIDNLEKQRNNIRLSKRGWEPQNLEELVIQEILSLYATNQQLNYDDVVNELGSNLKTEISKWMRGSNAVVSKKGKLLIQDFAQELQENSNIGEFDQQRVRDTIIDILSTYSGKASLREAIRQSRISIEREQIDYTLNDLYKRLDEIRNILTPKPKVFDDKNGFQEGSVSVDDLGTLLRDDIEEEDEDTPEDIAEGLALSNPNFNTAFEEFIFKEDTSEEENKIFSSIISKYSNNLDTLDKKIRGTKKSEILELYKQVKDDASLIKLLDKIDKCGL